MTSKEIKADLEKLHVKILEVAEIKIRQEKSKDLKDTEYINSLRILESELTNDLLNQVLSGIIATELVKELDRNDRFTQAVHKAGFHYGAIEELKRRLQKTSKEMLKLQKKEKR